METPSLENWISDILNRDAATFEDAYWGKRPASSEAIPVLLAQMELYNDPYTRGKLIELLGECEDEGVIPVLEKELEHPDEAIRNWAEHAIKALERKEKWQKDIKYL